jgi:hypothetical protein
LSFSIWNFCGGTMNIHCFCCVLNVEIY